LIGEVHVSGVVDGELINLQKFEFIVGLFVLEPEGIDVHTIDKSA